jgi:hypothetical protein
VKYEWRGEWVFAGISDRLLPSQVKGTIYERPVLSTCSTHVIYKKCEVLSTSFPGTALYSLNRLQPNSYLTTTVGFVKRRAISAAKLPPPPRAAFILTSLLQPFAHALPPAHNTRQNPRGARQRHFSCRQKSSRTHSFHFNDSIGP